MEKYGKQSFEYRCRFHLHLELQLPLRKAMMKLGLKTSVRKKSAESENVTFSIYFDAWRYFKGSAKGKLKTNPETEGSLIPKVVTLTESRRKFSGGRNNTECLLYLLAYLAGSKYSTSLSHSFRFQSIDEAPNSFGSFKFLFSSSSLSACMACSMDPKYWTTRNPDMCTSIHSRFARGF